MANTILHKRSSTPAAVPGTGDLSLGELAINTYDGKVYMKKDDGVASVVPVSADIGDVAFTSTVGEDNIDSTKDILSLSINGTTAAASAYTTPTGFDATTIGANGSYAYTTSLGSTAGHWNATGTVYYIITAKVSTTSYTMTEYTCSTPFDISTITGSTANTFDSGISNASFVYWWFNADGTKWNIVFNTSLYEFTLNAAYDFTVNPTNTASNSSVLSLQASGYGISDDGATLWYSHISTYYQATMSTPYDISTIGATTTYDATTEHGGGVVKALCGDNSNNTLIVAATDSVDSYMRALQYSYGTPGDISTLTLQADVPYALYHQGNGNFRLDFDADGTNFWYLVSSSTIGDGVYQYTMTGGGGGTSAKFYHDGVLRLESTLRGAKVSGSLELTSYPTASLPYTTTGALVYDSTLDRLSVSDGTSWTPVMVNADQTFQLDGAANIYGGTSAGASLTAGATGNILAGTNAGTAITSGDNNIAIGVNALLTQATQSGCVAIGVSALEQTTTFANTAVGYEALSDVGATNSNTALGYQAGKFNTGGFNTFIGRGAGLGTVSTSTGGSNVCIGHQAGDAITTGNSNVLVGYDAGTLLTTGVNNTIIGFGAGANAPVSASSCVYIGTSAGPTTGNGANNELYIDNTETDTPLIFGDFSGNTVTINGDFDATGDIVAAGNTIGHIAENAQTGTSYTIVLTDDGKMVTMSNAAANTLTVPLNSTTAFPVGTQIIVIQEGAGQTTIAAAGGVTINSAGGLLNLANQYSAVTLVKKATDTWYLFGDLA